MIKLPNTDKNVVRARGYNMKYIVNLNQPFNKAIEDDLVNSNIEIEFVSNVLPYIICIADSSSRFCNKDYINSVDKERIGSYQNSEFTETFIINPRISKSALIDSSLIGWGGTKIFVLDSGVDKNKVHVTDVKDFVGTGILDRKNHGTFVTKIIKHFARGANIYIGKIGEVDPSESALLQAIEWAHSSGADVINISSMFAKEDKYGNFINCDGSCNLCKLIDFVSGDGMTVVVAAGNQNQVENSIYCPATAREAVTVAAISEDSSRLAEYSSKGLIGGNKPNLLAPGDVSIDGIRKCGTSFAAPIVSGILAAITSKFSTSQEALEVIYKTATDLKLPSHEQGKGLIDVKRIVEVISNESIDIKRQGHE